MTGKDKKMNYPIIKHLRINEKQNAKWNPKLIRGFLEGNYLKFLYELLETKFELKKDFSPEELDTLLKIEEILGK